jgi:hypothetical protein
MIGNWEFPRSWQLSAWLSIENMNKILATAIHSFGVAKLGVVWLLGLPQKK